MSGWGLANPAGLAWCLLALPILALHILRPRRIQERVSAIFLWREVATPVTAASPWQRLIPSWLLAAQVLAALLLGLLMAGPYQSTEALLGEHTVFVIDGSASMQATDADPTRIEQARQRALELRGQVPEGGEVSLVVAGSNARALLTHSRDASAFDEAVRGLVASDGAGDFAGAFALAAGLDSVDTETQVVFISDGGVSTADLRLAPLGTRYEQVGRSATNRGVTQLSAEQSSGGLTVRATVTHFGGPQVTQSLRIDVDGVTVSETPIELGPGDVQNVAIQAPPGERVEAFLAGEDVLAIDNRSVAVVPVRADIDVLVVGQHNVFLDAALGAIPGVRVLRAESFPVDSSTIDASVDLVIADRVTPPADLDLPLLAIAPPDGAADIVVANSVEQPVLTLISNEAGLVAGLDLSGLVVASSQVLVVPDTAEVLLGAEQTPLLVRTRSVGGDTLYLSFELDQSSLPLEAAFPLLIERALTELTGLVNPPARLTVGADLPLDSRLAAHITSPSGTSETVPPGSSYPTANDVGFWTISQDGRADIIVAVTADRAESQVSPVPDLPFDTGFVETGQVARAGQHPWRNPLLWALLGTIVLEWLLARRRVGVGPAQWRIASSLRLAIAAAIVVALIAPTIQRPATDVATVFLVDVSDSMGAAGKAEAVAVVREALAEQPQGSVAGIVAFGSDARLDQLVNTELNFSGITVSVDPAASDLAAALRLGAAALPADSRRRLVLISDGRATTGDVAKETQRLADEQIPVDVIVVSPPSGNDASVASVQAPSLARAGEKVTIRVSVTAPAAGPGRVTLVRDGTVVGERDLDLVLGENTLVFEDIASDEGVLRYQADVSIAGDKVTANDVGYAAVPVVGAEAVLVVEGKQGEAKPLVDDLLAAGMNVDQIDVDRLPSIDELATYATVVLVNVDRRDLSEGQVRALSGAVRDLGRGLLIVGGNQAYALGGYRDSDLEELLPVISEITDPLRRQTVAEVLMIDTSGSMAACHCDEEGQNGLGGGNRIDGGVSKTAIARNAAARAIAALGATDEVGVLSVNAEDRWVLDLQASPSQDDIDTGLSQLVPEGPTFVDTGLLTAAAELRESQASLKHIIFFSDGFTEPQWLELLAEQASELAAEGITVSVVATGEGAAEDLRPIAEAGGGRFYPGRNLQEIPELIAQEAVVASRDFVAEGEFFPLIARSGPASNALRESPVLQGYVATTERSTARVELRIGPDEDPLLASWQAGLGRVSVWTSDAGARWASTWVGWDGAPDFWAAVVKDTFPVVGDGAGLQAVVVDGQLQLRLESTDDFAGDAKAIVRIATPEGPSQEVVLERLDGSTFAGAVAVEDAGTYAVGASVSTGEGESQETLWSGIGLATRSYPAEYAHRPVGTEALTRVANGTGGRVDPLAAELFDAAGTVAGSRSVDLWRWLLWFALLAWPLAVALSRLSWRRGVLAVPQATAAKTVTELKRRLPKMSEPTLRGTLPTKPDQAPPSSPPSMAASTPAPDNDADPANDAASTLDQLLARKRKKP